MRLNGSFRAHYRYKLNEVGRVSIPSKFRDVLNTRYNSDSLVLVMGKKCIIAYPVEEWASKEEEFLANPPSTPASMFEMRSLLASAEDVQLDKNGRILIPNSVRNSMGLKDECVFLGLVNRFEIWSSQQWDVEMAKGNPAEDGGLSDNMNEFIL